MPQVWILRVPDEVRFYNRSFADHDVAILYGGEK